MPIRPSILRLAEETPRHFPLDAGGCAASLPDDAAEDSFNMLPALFDEPRDGPIRDAIVNRSGEATLAIR